MFALSTRRLCSSLRRHLISPISCKPIATVTLHHIDNGVLQVLCEVMERVSPSDFLRFSFLPPLDHPRHFKSSLHTLSFSP